MKNNLSQNKNSIILKASIILIALTVVCNKGLYSAATIGVHGEDNSEAERKAEVSSTHTLTEDSKALGLKLLEAALKGNKETVEKLIKAGTNINAANRDGITPLMLAAIKGHKDIAKLLIDVSANIDATDRYGRTALIWAASGNYKDIAGLLIDSGANIDAVDRSGYTALILTTRNGHKDTVQLLIDAGANIDIADKRGDTALMMAAKFGHKDIVKMLTDEPKRREAAQIRRKVIDQSLKEIETLPPVLTKLIDSYLPTNMRSILADAKEAEAQDKGSKANV